jgi:MFS family permease
MDVETRSGAAKSTLRHNVRNLPPAAWILVAGAFINRVASFAAVFLILFLRNGGFSIVRAGWVVAAYGVGELAGSALGGWLADRIGRRSTIVLSLYASAVAVLGLSRVGSLAVAVAVAFVAGLVFEAHRPAALALMADIVPPEGLVTAYAVLRLAANLGFAVGSVVAGFLAARSFVWIFVTDAATSVVFATLALTALPQGRVSRREQEPPAAAIHTAVADRAFLGMLVASVMIAFVFSQSQSTLPLEVVSRPGLTTQSYGWLLALNSVMVVLFELPISGWTMHRPPRLMISLGCAVIGLGFGLTTLATSLPALAGTVAIWTLGEMVALPIGVAYVARLAPDNLRGRYQGLYAMALALGGISGPAFGSMLFATSPPALWALCAALGGLAALILLVPNAPRMIGLDVSPELIPEPANVLLDAPTER